MTAAETSTKVVLGGTRGGPDEPTLRQDRWWLQPFTIAFILTIFIVYSTWAAFQNRYYFVGAGFGRDLISPFYSPCIGGVCVPGAKAGFAINWFRLSPALLILIFPLGFRFTCYYYRRSYYAGLVFNVFLTIDAVEAFREPGIGWGVSVGTIVLCVNAVLLWMYSLSCHACRHLCGGHVKSFKAHPIRYRIWKFLTPLNAKHMNLAWTSLIFVALTDVYVRLVASGAISDYKLF